MTEQPIYLDYNATPLFGGDGSDQRPAANTRKY